MTHKILRIDSSARHAASVSRALTERIIARLRAAYPGAHVTQRDLTDPLPQVTEAWIQANFTAPAERSPQQVDELALSDRLVDELVAADTLVIGLPVYNFGVSASLKAWIDLVTRVGRTFAYTQTGPKGLLSGKRAIVAMASGGTGAGSELDFATPYLRQVLRFNGIDDVTVIAADALATDAEASIAAAQARADSLAA